MTPEPPSVVVHVWTVPRRRVAWALARAGSDRARLRSTSGLRFGKILGTGDGRTFTVRDATPCRWMLLAVFDEPTAARTFETRSPLLARWSAAAHEHARYRLLPLASRGRWSGREPFGPPAPAPWSGPVAALTRARLRPVRVVAFWRAVPAVSADLRSAAGLRLALGFGEAPIGWQGTFSLWDSEAALREFAYRRAPHQTAIRRTHEVGWYAEELFARFGLLEATPPPGSR